MVIINWNYDKYVGQSIDSVKNQGYTELEVLVVDNSSTDDSLSVIDEHIKDDERFKLIKLTKNLGQLGAFFEVYKKIHGKLVVSLDADDVLFPNFIATHVQAHLALGNSVALTSSDVTIVGKDGEIIKHGYQGRSHEQPDEKGFMPLKNIPRLPQMDKQAYEKLEATLSSYHGLSGWIWGPGTSNMYRRSLLDKIYERPKHKVWMRSSDNFLNPLAHALVGTALIDQELSAYRMHGANYYGTMQVAGGGRKDKAARELQLKDFYETTDWLLRRAAYYEPLLGEKYWDALKSVSKFIAPPTGRIMPASPDTVALLERNYGFLCEVFPKSVLKEKLPTFFTIGDIHSATHDIDLISRSRIR